MSDTFLDSAWYFLRYPSHRVRRPAFDPARTKKWLPVATYIGGNEHAVLHLLYSRFITWCCTTSGYLDFEEPFRKFRAHGLIVKDGAKMSKSRGNVVIPDEYIAQWGADTFRHVPDVPRAVPGGRRLPRRGHQPARGGSSTRCGTWSASASARRAWARSSGTRSLVKWHQTKKKVTEDLEELSYNTAIAALMELLNALRASGLRRARDGRRSWW